MDGVQIPPNCRALGKVCNAMGLPLDEKPTLLLWGVPVPADVGPAIAMRERLIEISDKLGERATGRSEPDCIVGSIEGGISTFEIKYRSGNEVKPEHYDGWDKYLGNTSCFKDPDGIRRSGLYELARNWRIMSELAGSSPFALVNLGPVDLFKSKRGERLDSFQSCLNLAPASSFRQVAWPAFCGAFGKIPDWLSDYLRIRGLYP